MTKTLAAALWRAGLATGFRPWLADDVGAAMADSTAMTDEHVGDAPAQAKVHSVELLAQGFRRYERFQVTLVRPDGIPMSLDREVLQAGPTVCVLPVDLDRQEVVLVRQFRLAAHLATGSGDLVELVAGRVDPGETAQDAACRECREEIGLDSIEIAPLMTFMPAVALADEVMSLWIARVDARTVPDVAGHAEENEYIRPLRVDLDAAVGLLAQNVIMNAPLIIALQWLAANRNRLPAALSTGRSVP